MQIATNKVLTCYPWIVGGPCEKENLRSKLYWLPNLISSSCPNIIIFHLPSLCQVGGHYFKKDKYITALIFVSNSCIFDNNKSGCCRLQSHFFLHGWCSMDELLCCDFPPRWWIFLNQGELSIVKLSKSPDEVASITVNVYMSSRFLTPKWEILHHYTNWKHFSCGYWVITRIDGCDYC